MAAVSLPGAAPFHPVVRGEVFHGLGCLGVLDFTIHDGGDLERVLRGGERGHDDGNVIATDAGIFCGGRQRVDESGCLCAAAGRQAIEQHLAGRGSAIAALEDLVEKTALRGGEVVTGERHRVGPGIQLYDRCGRPPAQGFGDGDNAPVADGQALAILRAEAEINTGTGFVLHSKSAACCHKITPSRNPSRRLRPPRGCKTVC